MIDGLFVLGGVIKVEILSKSLISNSTTASNRLIVEQFGLFHGFWGQLLGGVEVNKFCKLRNHFRELILI